MPKGRRIPTGIQNNLGDGKLEKGNWQMGDEKIYILAWDFAKECEGDKCPIHHLCKYKESWKMKPEKQGQPGATSNCLLHQRYLKNVMHGVIQKMQSSKDFTQESVLKLGYQLLPLYDQLFKFKMWEYGNQQLVYVSEKGTPKVHPVYKEIREIIKSITGVWREIGGLQKDDNAPKGLSDTSFIDAVANGTEEEPQEVAQDVSQEGAGMDFSESQAEAPKKKKKSGVNRKRQKEAAKKRAAKKKRKDRVTKDVTPYSKYDANRDEDE